MVLEGDQAALVEAHILESASPAVPVNWQVAVIDLDTLPVTIFHAHGDDGQYTQVHFTDGNSVIIDLHISEFAHRYSSYKRNHRLGM